MMQTSVCHTTLYLKPGVNLIRELILTANGKKNLPFHFPNQRCLSSLPILQSPAPPLPPERRKLIGLVTFRTLFPAFTIEQKLTGLQGMGLVNKAKTL